MEMNFLFSHFAGERRRLRKMPILLVSKPCAANGNVRSKKFFRQLLIAK